MKSKTVVRMATFAALLSLVLAACGQREGVHAGGVGLVGPGDPSATLGPNVDPSAGGGLGGTVPKTGPGGGTLPPGVEVPPGEVLPPISGPGDRTGITDTSITIGIHAPTTGAAPIPSSAFEIGKDLYWNYLRKTNRHKIYGREVKIVFANDDYNPTTAVSVCKKMAEAQKAFLLIGGAGTDQIRACAADYAAPRGIPYLSPGVQEAGLSQLTNYFTVTMTYKQQMPLLVQLLKAEGDALDKFGAVGGGKDGTIRIAHVRPNTPNFNDADQALRAAAQAAGFDYKVYTVVKEGNSTEAKTVAAQAERDGVDVVVPITAPTFTVQMALNSDSNGYKPRWAGVAITNNINAFVDTVCNRTGRQSGMEGAIFFSPWPGIKSVMAGQIDPAFAQAVNEFVPANFDMRKNGDLILALWGIMRGVHQAFLAAGKDMSRESFSRTMAQFRLSTKIFPDLVYKPGSPFGAQNVRVLKASCDEPGDGERIPKGAQYIDHPSYPGLRNSF